MIKIKNLFKAFDDRPVLTNINCTIKDCSVYGLVGVNGVGKSTLLRIMSGVFSQDKGELLYDTSPVSDETVMQEIVFVPDDLYFFSGYTLLETAKFYQALYKKFDLDEVVRLAGSFKLELNVSISKFSKGMKRQAAIICALATNAKYVFLDETFDGLDPLVKKKMKSLISKKIIDNKSTVVLTSHSLRELEDICDHLIVMSEGSILFESEVDSLKTNMLKIQISLKKDFDRDDFKMLNIVTFKKSGSVATIIARDKNQKAFNDLKKLKPLLLESVPLSLEEVFIYEMEALGYEFDEII